MPDLPEAAVRAAEDAYRCAHTSGLPHGEIARVVVQAAAPWIVAQTLIQERRRVVRLVRRTLVPRGCQPTHDAAELIKAIKGDLHA